LETGSRGESRPDRDEALIETEWSLVLKDLCKAVYEAVVKFSIIWLIHKSCPNDIKWGDRASHEKSCCESGHELKLHAFFETSRLHLTLADIIATHLRSIEHHCSHDIGLDTLIESAHTLIFINFPSKMSYTP